MGVCGQHHAPAALPLGKTQYHCNLKQYAYLLCYRNKTWQCKWSNLPFNSAFTLHKLPSDKINFHQKFSKNFKIHDQFKMDIINPLSSASVYIYLYTYIHMLWCCRPQYMSTSVLWCKRQKSCEVISAAILEWQCDDIGSLFYQLTFPVCWFIMLR